MSKPTVERVAPVRASDGAAALRAKVYLRRKGNVRRTTHDVSKLFPNASIRRMVNKYF